MVSIAHLKTLTIGRLCIAISYFTCGLVINCVQVLLHLFVKPLNKTLFRKLMKCVCYPFYSHHVFIAEWYATCPVRVYMDAEDEKYVGKEHALAILNHTYDIDWNIFLVLMDKYNALGNYKAYAKKAISYVPVVGWCGKMAELIFLDRNLDKDKEIIAKQLKVVYSYPDPVWLLLNAEGTRFTQTKHEASVKFAEERGMTVLKHHLIPRSRGFTTSLPSIRGICPVVYDMNLVFKKDAKVPPTMLSLLNGRDVEPYLFVRRIPLKEVPEDEKEAAAWLQNLFVEKDRIIDSFHETGSFFKNSGIKEVPFKMHHRRLATLLNFIAWATVSISMIFYYLITSVLAQNWTGFGTCISVLLIVYMLMEKSINMSQSSKSSSYGVNTAKPAQK